MGSGGYDSDDGDSPVIIQGYKLNVGKKRLQQVCLVSLVRPSFPLRRHSEKTNFAGVLHFRTRVPLATCVRPDVNGRFG